MNASTKSNERQKMNTKRIKHICLLPGHSIQSEGASLAAGRYRNLGEYAVASTFLPSLAIELEKHGYQVSISERKSAGGTTPYYSAAAANRTNADIALEFHFNSFSTETAKGTEILYWGKSGTGYEFANLLGIGIAGLIGTVHRGAKPITSSNDRGFSAFVNSRMPFFMIEPIFGSNPQESIRYGELIHSGKWASEAAALIHNAIHTVYNS